MKIKNLLLLLLFSAGIQKILQSQITWNFSNASASGVPVNITAATITQNNNNGNTGFIAGGNPASVGYAGASGGNNGNCRAKTGLLNLAANGSTYIETSLTPAAGYWVNITNIKWGNFSLATSGPVTLSVYTSNDNFTTSTLAATAAVTQSATVWSLLNPVIAPINGITGTAVTIRIYASGGTGTTPNTGANWRIDDLAITATAQTGTTGNIPKYSSGTTFTNSIITENSGNIGIGNPTPSQKLDVAGNLKFSGLLYTAQALNASGLAGQVLQSNGPVNPPTWVNGSGGTVTAIGITPANGVSGVSSGGATPNLTISLGAITPASVSATGNITGANLTGTNTGDNAPNTLYSGLISNATHTGDATGSTVLTLATVNSNVGTFTNPTFTVNGKGLITAASNGATPVTVESDPVVRSINGLVKSNGVAIAAALAGTDYLLPTGSAAGLTSFPILNQNTTGNAATATSAVTISGGTAGSMPYQTGAGTTSFVNPGTVGYLLTSNGTGTPTWTNPLDLSGNAWGLSGNALPPANNNFIGTTNNNDLVFKVNNIESGRLGAANENTAMGVNAANASTGSYVTAFGNKAAYNNTNDFVTALGTGAAHSNTGYLITATGNNAAYTNTGNIVTATGVAAAFGNTGNNVTATGVSAAGTNNTGNDVTATGFSAAAANSGNSVTATGSGSGQNNSGNNLTATGYIAASANTGTNVTALGYKAAYANTNNNITAIGAYATVTVDNAISLGSIDGINGATADAMVGIGTTAPTEKLHIQNGTIRIVNGTEGAGKILTSDADGVASWADAPNGSATAWGLQGNAGTNPGTNFIGTTDFNDLVFKVNNYVSGRINLNNNNTSFGIFSALNPTPFNYNITATGSFSAQNNTGNNVTATGAYAAGNNSGNEVFAAGVAAAENNQGSNVVALGTYAAEFNTGNNVTVSGYYSSQSNTGNNVSANGAFAAQFNTGNNVSALGYKAAANNIKNNITAIGAFATVSVDNAISLGSINGINGATADTKVGIGTPAPTEKLHIQNGTIRIVDGTQGAGKVLTSDANGVASWQASALLKTGISADNGLVQTGSNIGLGSSLNQVTDITNNGFALNIKGNNGATTFTEDGNLFSSGKIAIGITDLKQIGSNALAVNGSAIFTKVSVKLQGNWPDYVFDSAYHMMPLPEVEKYITLNNHLPGLAPAAEIQKNGIDLGENQTVLVKKLEELTLYAIEANKKIELQQAQIELLLKQNKAIAELQEAIKKLKNK